MSRNPGGTGKSQYPGQSVLQKKFSRKESMRLKITIGVICVTAACLKG